MELNITPQIETPKSDFPSDWEIKALPDVIDFIHGKAHEQFINPNGEFIVVNSKFISTEGNVAKYSSYNFCPAKKGDVLTVLSDLPNGKALAKCYYVDRNNLYAVNQRICIWRSKKSYPKYLFYIMNRHKHFLKFDDGVTQTHILNHHIKECPIPLPPTLTEQKAIATALSDVDALIASLDKLIEKKKAIKQGVMQELLTGKRRLAGFGEGVGYKKTELREIPEDWEVKELGELSEVVGGGTPSTKRLELWGGDVNWFTPSEIGDEKYVYESERTITSEGLKSSSAKLLPKGTILLTTRASIGESSILEQPATTNQGFQSLIVRSEFDIEYVYYKIQMMKGVLIKYSSGSTFLEISPSRVRSIKISIPEREAEQIAISKVLCDIDEELDFLLLRMKKLINTKTGMMQELLTGKTRMV